MSEEDYIGMGAEDETRDAALAQGDHDDALFQDGADVVDDHDDHDDPFDDAGAADNDHEAFAQQTYDAEEPDAAHGYSSGGDQLGSGGEGPLSDPQGAQPAAEQEFLQQGDAESDAEGDAALKAFERKWQEELREKDTRDQAKREEMRAAAGKELEQHKAQKGQALEAAKKANREQEAALVESINEALAAENPWERIVSLVDVNQANPDQKERDLSRLRKMLLQLKSAPPKEAM